MRAIVHLVNLRRLERPFTHKSIRTVCGLTSEEVSYRYYSNAELFIAGGLGEEPCLLCMEEAPALAVIQFAQHLAEDR